MCFSVWMTADQHKCLAEICKWQLNPEEFNSESQEEEEICSCISFILFSLHYVLMETWKLFLEILLLSLPVACFFFFVYPLVFYMTADQRDDRGCLTLSPAASIRCSGACCIITKDNFLFCSLQVMT